MKLEQSVSEITFVAFDLETTGLNPTIDRIIEIGAIKFKQGKELESFNELIDPQMPLPTHATSVSGIHNAMLLGKPQFADIIEPFCKFVNDAILIAHNAPFDIGFLRTEMQSDGREFFLNTIIDTLELARRAIPSQKAYGLQNLVEALGLPKNNAHRALDDAIQCKRIFEECCQRIGFMGDLSLKDLLA